MYIYIYSYIYIVIYSFLHIRILLMAGLAGPVQLIMDGLHQSEAAAPVSTLCRWPASAFWYLLEKAAPVAIS